MYVTNLSTCFTGTFYQHCYLLYVSKLIDQYLYITYTYT